MRQILIILTISSLFLHPLLAQTQCSSSFSDRFCQMCNATANSCLSCYNGYSKVTGSGVCWAEPVPGTSNINNVKLTSSPPPPPTTTSISFQDPYYSSNKDSCLSLVEGTSSITRYLTTSDKTCHLDCGYGANSYMATTTTTVIPSPPPGPAMTMTTYTCNACQDNNVFQCLTSGNATTQECKYSLKRYQGSVTSANFLSKYSTGQVLCSNDQRSGTETYYYYVKPFKTGFPPECSSGCGVNNTASVWDDLTQVFLDIQSKSGTYLKITVYIYLLKNTATSSTTHFLLDKSTSYNYNFYTTNPTTLPRPFERQYADVYIAPYYCSISSITGCISSSETVTIRFNSYMTHIFVTGNMKVENVIFEFADLASTSNCRESPTACCTFDGTTLTASCDRKIDYDQWDQTTTYETTYIAKRKYGVFTMQYLRDYPSAPIPSLTLNNVVVQNFFFSKFHTSFIEVDRFAGQITIQSSTFNRFMFPHGLISNANVDADRKFLWETTYDGNTCRGTNSGFTTCHSLTIDSSTFKNYNPNKAKATTVYTNRFEGSIVMLHNFDGLIKITSSTFEKFLPFSIINSTNSALSGCYDYYPYSWGQNPSAGQDYHNIKTGSKHKIFLDKHFRKYAENVNSISPITAPIYIRNVTRGVVIHDNTFNQIYSIAGGSIYIQGFAKTFSNPLIISKNTFTNNFAQFFALNIMIFKLGVDFPSLNCHGILIDNNNFTSNYGCYNTFGNVIVDCEPNDNIHSASGSTDFDTYYTTYNPSVNHNWESDTPSTAYNATYYFQSVKTLLSTPNTYTHPVTSETFDPYKITISNNYFYDNHAIISNCLYVEGVVSLYIYKNTFISNSINRAGFYSSTFLSNNAWSQISTSTAPTGGSYMSEGTYMVESSPVIIRITNYFEVENNTFDGNTQGLYGGDIYFAQAITIHQAIGKESSKINNCIFQNHQGFSTTYATSIMYPAYAATGLITLNYFEDWNALIYTPGPTARKNDDTYLTVSNSYFYNNQFNYNSSYDTKNMYYDQQGRVYSNYPNFNAGFFKFFTSKEVTADSQITAVSQTPTSNTQPPTNYLFYLIVSYSGNTFVSNTFADGMCGFNRYALDKLSVTSSTFTSNSFTETFNQNAYLGGLFCITDDTTVTWTQTPIVDISNNVISSGTGAVLMLRNIYSNTNAVRPGMVLTYLLFFTYNTIYQHSTTKIAPLYNYASNLVSIKHLKISNITANTGFLYCKTIYLMETLNITVSQIRTSRIALIYADNMNTAEITGVTAYDITFTGSILPDSTNSIINAGDSSKVNCLVQFKDRATLSSFTLHDINLETYFIGDSGSFSIKSSTIYNGQVTRAMFILFNSEDITVQSSTIYNIQGISGSDSAIFMISSATLRVISSTFYNITGDNSVIINSNIGEISFESSNISYCTGSSGTNTPSLIKAQLGSVKIKKTYIGYNTGVGQGTISTILTDVTCEDDTFVRNTAVYGSHNFYISTVESTVMFSNCTFTDDPVYDSSSKVSATFIVLFDGDLTVTGSTFTGAHNLNGGIYLNGEVQTLNLVNSKFYNSYIPPQRAIGVAAGVINAQSVLSIVSCYFENNTYAIMTGGGASLMVRNTIFKNNINVTLYIDSITSNKFINVTFDGHENHATWSKTKSSNTDKVSGGIYCLNCPSIEISNSLFQNLNLLGSNSEYYGAAMQVTNPGTTSSVTTILQISGTKFINNIADSGGALYINVPTPNIITGTITDSTFTTNYAIQQGGAIYFHGYKYSAGSLTLAGSTSMSFSYAGRAGGAIYYGSLRPTTSIASSSLFSNNSSPYGPNYASYPISLGIVKDPDSSLWASKSRLLLEEGGIAEEDVQEIEEIDSRPYPLRTLTDIITTDNPTLISGQYMDPPVVIALLDHDNQACTIWNEGTAKITFVTTEVQSYTSTTFSVTKGYIVLYPMKLTYYPDKSTNATISISVTTTSGLTSDTSSLVLKTQPYFRDCTRGERHTDSNECLKCSSGQYILSRTYKGTCSACPDNLNCFGGDLIGPSSNYWRLDGWKNRGVRCQNDEACLGYSIDTNSSNSSRLLATSSTSLYDCTEKYNDTFCLSGFCSSRYQGNLCATCSKGNAKSSQIYCVPCSNNPGYYVLFIVILVVAVGFIVFTVKNAMKVKPEASKEKPKSAILMKILTNYLQLVSIVASFDFKWPDQVTSMFSAQTKVASSSSTVFSIDCFYPEATPGSSVRPFFVKLLFLSLSPILLVILSATVWYIVLKIYAKKNEDPEKRKIDMHEFKSKLTTTCVVLLFMIHTNIVQTTLLALKCYNLGDVSGDEIKYYMDQDLDIECYSGLWLYWALGCAIPAFVFWGLGIPLFALRLLKNNKKRLEDITFKSKFGFLYDGYKFKKYYWEFVILYRKIAMVFISIFLVTFGTKIQALAVLGVCFLSYVMQIFGEPFTTDDLNNMEKRSMLYATVTLYAGIYFVSGALPSYANWILLIVILIVNIHFILLWAKDLLMDYKRQYQEGKEKKLQAKLEKEEKIKQLKLQHAPSQEIRDLENPPKKPLLPACAKKKKKPDAKYEMVQTEREKEKKKKRALCFKSNKTSDF